ncbi:MAG: ATP-binding cassette domain-containing protein, partial [Methylacidiphilales bacterium]|nr:ATP-binding cassette domain-containing protein [Candidatus Methylacidiphilales bacterium]
MTETAALPQEKPLIEAVNVSRVLTEAVPVTLVRDVNLVIFPREFVAITGPSGSGKSSLLYLLGLLDLPSEGEVRMLGRPTAKISEDERARIRLEGLGFVFQFHFLLPEFTARANVMLPMRALGVLSESEMRRRADDILAQLGLAEHAAKRPDQMSGGQRQRVAVARALANDPP